jgi:hypothetical protein
MEWQIVRDTKAVVNPTKRPKEVTPLKPKKSEFDGSNSAFKQK